MFKIKEIERMKILANLIELSKPIDEILVDLSAFPWDGTENLVTLNSKDMHHVLTEALEGKLSIIDLEKWANAVEVNEGIAFESDELKDIVFLLANPEINNILNADLFQSLLKKLIFHRICLPYNPEPNTAKPEVTVDGYDIVLNFTALDDNEETLKAGIQFSDCLVYRVGSPNDEGFYSDDSNNHTHNDSIYSFKRFPNLEINAFYEVIGLNMENGLTGEKQVKVQEKEITKEYKHYLFLMKDGTFECVARAFKIQR